MRGEGFGIAGLVVGIIGASLCVLFWLVVIIANIY